MSTNIERVRNANSLRGETVTAAGRTRACGSLVGL